MNIKFLKVLAFVVSLSFTATPVFATLITDTVVVGDKEWAQVNLFSGTTWNGINAQCPTGVCGSSSSINSFALSGWTWATQANVGDFLFGPLTAHTGGVSRSFEEPIDNLNPFITATGFNLTRDDVFICCGTGFVDREIYGLTSNAVGAVAFGSYQQVIRRSSRTRFDTASFIGADQVAQFNGGAWFYRSTSVPEPSTLAIFALGMMGLAARRFKK